MRNAGRTLAHGVAISFLFLSGVFAQEDPMTPFWKGKVAYHESVLMVSKEGGLPEAKLLFEPKKILRVTDSGLTTTFKKGKDWTYKNRTLQLLPGSAARSMTDRELAPDSGRFARVGGGFVLHHEGSFFHERQLAVTYRHKKDRWNGPVPSFAGDVLSETLEKLQDKKDLHILLFGDSIAAGANASAKSDAAPYLPSFGTLFVNRLKKHYKTDIRFTNTAVGGKTSKWGEEVVLTAVAGHHPDLVIVAFGMNDGTGKMPAETFKSHIAAILQQTRAVNPKAEFILVSTMLPNPESKFVGTQRDFKRVLEELTGPGCILVDMTAVHDELLQRKSYQDLTGNNINHPNDYLIRWYAQFLAGSLIPAKAL
jgi:hypothetical protein